MKDIVSTSMKAQADKPTQLEPGERLFLWGFRALAQHRHCGHPVLTALRECYSRFGVEDAAVLVDALADAFFHAAHTPIAIHSAPCPCVSDDEALLLRAMASAQFGDRAAARQRLAHWLPEAAAEWVLGPATELGRLFHAAGLSFCLAEVDGDATVQTATQSWPIGSRTVH